MEGKDTGAALLLEPGPDFYDRGEMEERKERKFSFSFVILLLISESFSVDTWNADGKYLAADHAVSYSKFGGYWY